VCGQQYATSGIVADSPEEERLSKKDRTRFDVAVIGFDGFTESRVGVCRHID
jgi:hypothetical protein